jgi:hypothetical protein
VALGAGGCETRLNASCWRGKMRAGWTAKP